MEPRPERIASGDDLTERLKRAEEALRTRELDFQLIVDDRKRAEAQLAGEKRLLEMVASSCPLTDVLSALCKFVEDTSPDCYCGVYLIDWSGPKFRIGAVPSLPAMFNDPVDGLPVSTQVGPCGVAALTKTQVIATDLESDPLWQASSIKPLALALQLNLWLLRMAYDHSGLPQYTHETDRYWGRSPYSSANRRAQPKFSKTPRGRRDYTIEGTVQQERPRHGIIRFE